MRQPGEISPFTGPGYKNDFNRVGHNGPMDDATRKIVKFVAEFKASKMTPEATHAFNRTLRQRVRVDPELGRIYTDAHG